jgi:methionyl-tRNA formyltransferase
MRVILAGQKSFGVVVYDMLRKEGHEIAAVWSPADKNDKLTKRSAGALLWTPTVERSPKAVLNLEVDLFVAAHSHDFIGKASRAATRLGGIGYHPSLLPRHRGRDAVHWTVYMGDAIAGGSVYWLTDHVDGGPIASQDYCFVRPDDDASSLWRRDLFPMGVRLLAQVLRDLDEGHIVEVPQDESVATWEPSVDRPPLYRPELPQIGRGVNGYTHHVTRDALRDRR